jgi:hypothetical protein
MNWQFAGDGNLEYGGSFIDLDTFNDGYCSAVRVTDLDSACGFRGACLIEHMVINGTTDPTRIREAIRSWGGMKVGPRPKGMTAEERKTGLRHWIADALLSYGYADPDDSWDNYRSHYMEVVQMDPEASMKFDGWKANKRLKNTSLEDYVESVHLD